MSSRRNPFPRGGLADVATVRRPHPVQEQVQMQASVHDDCPAAPASRPRPRPRFSPVRVPAPTGSRTIQPPGVGVRSPDPAACHGRSGRGGSRSVEGTGKDGARTW